MAQRQYRRERKFAAALNVPMTPDMRKALEDIADEEKISVVEAARRCIGSALEPARTQTLSGSDETRRERVLTEIAKALHKDPTSTVFEPNRNPHPEEVREAISEANRLGLLDVVVLLDGPTNEFDYLAFALIDIDPEERIDAAKQRLMAQWRPTEP